jgi:hypothetical protein
MSTTFQEYKNRVHFKGATKRDYVNTKVRESIDSIIEDSQYGFEIEVLTYDMDNITGEHKETRTPAQAAILSTKSTQDYERANIITYNEVGLDRGSLIEWDSSKWIILQKMFRPEQPGFNGYAYRCTGELKWIDDNGTLQVRPGYISSGRTTNSLTYTPDVNYKFDNIVLHDTDWSMIAAIQQDLTIHNEMRFIVKGKAYRVTNIDNVSIDNVSILSMVDDKLLDSDMIFEDGTGVAAKMDYEIKLNVEEPLRLFAGDIRQIPITVTRDGIVVDEYVSLTSLHPDIVEVDGTSLIGRGVGEAKVICALKRNPLVTKTIQLFITEEHPEPEAPKFFIEGSDAIEWNTDASYTLSDDQVAEWEVEVFSKVKHTITYLEGRGVNIAIKDKYAGTIVVTAILGDTVVSKEILIQTV